MVDAQSWSLQGVRSAMETTPARCMQWQSERPTALRIVVGKFFDWHIRLDYGAEGKLRLVYELAKPNEAPRKEMCFLLCRRWPSASTAFLPPCLRGRRNLSRPSLFRISFMLKSAEVDQVVYNGQSVFHEKPVFICSALRAPRGLEIARLSRERAASLVDHPAHHGGRAQ